MVNTGQATDRRRMAGRIRGAMCLRVMTTLLTVGVLPAPLRAAAPAADDDVPGGACQPAWSEGLFCPPGVDGAAHVAVTWDDGTGEALYVGGTFLAAGCTHAANIARWDGSTWSALGAGVDDTVSALAVFDDGSGGGMCWRCSPRGVHVPDHRAAPARRARRRSPTPGRRRTGTDGIRSLGRRTA